MFNANVYDLFIASPPDVQTERGLIETVIHEWNVVNARAKNTILRPVKWESSVYSDFLSLSPQASINTQALVSSDILIAIFWSRIGTPTKEFDSGTVEEFQKHIKQGKPALVFFSNERLPQDYDRMQFEKLQDFKELCKTNGVFFEYNNKQEFKDLSRNQISLLLNSDRYNNNNKEITENIAEHKYSKRKIDAIAFVQNIGNFNTDNTLLTKYLNELGDYRSLRLNDFFQETGLLSLGQTNQGLFISLSAKMWNMKEKDIQELLEDIKIGDYDNVLE